MCVCGIPASTKCPDNWSPSPIQHIFHILIARDQDFLIFHPPVLFIFLKQLLLAFTRNHLIVFPGQWMLSRQIATTKRNCKIIETTLSQSRYRGNPEKTSHQPLGHLTQSQLGQSKISKPCLSAEFDKIYFTWHKKKFKKEEQDKNMDQQHWISCQMIWQGEGVWAQHDRKGGQLAGGRERLYLETDILSEICWYI